VARDKKTRELQVEDELRRRTRLAVPAFAGGFLYLLSSIIISSTLNGAPTVGLIQGLTPALSGQASPIESPRTLEIKFVSHHALALVAGGALGAISFVVLVLILLLLADAAIYRRPETWSLARPFVLYGGIAVALATVGHEIVTAIETHHFAVSSNHSNRAAELALPPVQAPGGATSYEFSNYIGLLASLALAAGMIGIVLNALRVGLLPRWMGILGMFTGILVSPLQLVFGATLQIVPAFWMVMMGILYSGRWPKPAGADSGDPPAWASGEARPWPPRAPRGRPAARGAAVATADIAPAAAPPSNGASPRRRRRKRGPGPRR